MDLKQSKNHLKQFFGTIVPTGLTPSVLFLCEDINKPVSPTNSKLFSEAMEKLFSAWFETTRHPHSIFYNRIYGLKGTIVCDLCCQWIRRRLQMIDQEPTFYFHTDNDIQKGLVLSDVVVSIKSKPGYTDIEAGLHRSVDRPYCVYFLYGPDSNVS